MWAEEGAPVLPVAHRKLQLLFPQSWVFFLILLGFLAVGALGADTIYDSPAASPYIYEADSPLAYDAASPSAYDAASPVSPSSDRAASPSSPDPITNATFTKLFELSQSLGPVIMSRFGFCMKDVQYDWDRAFNFTNDLSFLKKCIRDTKGEMSLRMCTAAEIKFYFASILESGSKDMKPNRNCNTSTWLNGCEPGWACSLDNHHLIDLKSSKQLPTRTKNCVPCCEGFFCPHGLTCMIPCPRGAYCPIGTLNKDSGYCDPYRYKLPQGQPNHTCGAADYWADIRSSREVFCPAGSYCPSTVGKLQCTEGHYCRTGSIDQQRCYRMTDCEPGSDNQNLTAYGVMLFGGLTVILVILYNCSDQVMSFRERKTAKSREAAARSARETALEARERLKGVKETAKKTAVGLQTSLSRTFSRKRSSVKEHDEKGPSHSKQGSETGLPPIHPTSSAAQQSTPSTQREQSNLAKIVREIDENPEAHDGFNVEIGDKSLGTNVNAKELNTRSQIFKYAYGQIEKEKALQEQNKNLTYSGVMSMGTDIELRKRSTIEVAFKDLTLTLKGKNRHLLRCVTGKISPGRVSAVMGPSGAGKTTFLSALTGKAPGCTVTGRILINGKADSIQSYKKIIGFVPQDDIVHGNLTVEENLWFSAQCRLPAGLPKAEKVLILERVIESLGLQAVRDSLVGTVEKRGISGGQRKRVNVGLEMVMEPSLLILDEPTSGLDSSSSQLLLRALRREALEGVNICMVVHQPSYTLYRMFDDLILLAKGGLLVYLGSVKKVEEYFGGLGIHVPDRVNPPDHYIDILEGIVKPPDLDYKELPLKWMLHNGYHVPHNLRNDLGLAETSEIENNTSNETSDEAAASSGGQSSLLRDFWSDLKCIILLKSDRVQTNMLRSLDLSKRDTPGIFIQYKYFLIRVGKQRLREAGIQAVDYLILLLAGACLGTIAKVSDETFGAVGYTYTVIAVSLLCKIAALRSFALDKLNYWRESGSGMSSLAYFLAKDTIDNFNTLIKPLVYLSMFYFFNNPRSSFWDNYLIMVCLVYCVTGIAYSFAVFFEPSSAQLWSVLLPVVMTLIATQDKNNPLLKTVENICYPKWALEAFILANAQRYYGVWLITRCGALFKKNYDVNDFAVCLYILIATGIISRIVAFNFMVIFKRK